MRDDEGRTIKYEECEYVEELYTALNQGMLNYAKRHLRGASEEDVVQEVFCAALKKVGMVKSSPNPVGWLYQALKYEILTEIRRSVRGRELKDKLSFQYCGMSYEDMGDSLLKWDVRRMAGRCGIRQDDIELFLMHHLDGYKYEALAQAGGMPLATCKSKIHRAKKSLACFYAQWTDTYLNGQVKAVS